MVNGDITSTSKLDDHMEQQLINVDETVEKGSEVAKQVDHTKVSISFHMPLFDATNEMIGGNITRIRSLFLSM